MREIADMLAKAVKELDNDQVRFETYCATGDKDISQALQLTINFMGY